MDIKNETTSNGMMTPDINLERLHKLPEINLERLQKIAAELVQPGRFIFRMLNCVLVFVTNLLAGVLGSSLVRGHFHLALSGLVLFGPGLSLWVSKYSIFANKNHYLYRKFLLSAWGWTCIFTGSFIFLLSFCARRSLSLSLRHLSRIAAAGLLLWGCRRLVTVLENAAGTCYEPVTQGGGSIQGSGSPGQSLMLLHEDQTKASCLRAGMLWRGYEVSQDILILCLCCLLLVEEMSVFSPHLAQAGPLQRAPGSPLRLLFLLCAFLLAMWMFLLLCLLTHFPQFPSQQLGGAVGCLGWRGLYQGWYRLKPSWGRPGLPGEGLLTNTNREKQ